MNYEEIKSFTDVLRELEKDAFYAVDVEAGFKDGKIYVFQRRAVTTNTANDGTEFEKDDIIYIDTEIKCGIYVETGILPEGEPPFVCISNPLDFNESISVYLQSRTGNSAVFVVDGKYDFLARSNVLGVILSNRINNDVVILEKLNGGIFDFKPGEIGLAESLLAADVDTSAFERNMEVDIENIRTMLSAS